MNRIRVLLANYSMLVPEAIRRLVEEQDDMEIVGDCRGPMKILQETGRTKADAIILAQEGTYEPGLCSQLLSVYPDLVILGITKDTSSAYIQRMRPDRSRVDIEEQDDIVQVMRTAVGDSYSRQQL